MQTHTTLANVARAIDMNPKNARAKFRSLKNERPFDHTKQTQLTKPLAMKAAEFLATDFRTSEKA